MNKQRDFYDNGKGDRLINPLSYPKGVISFLEDEEKILGRLSDSFNLLIEVGCMSGRYLRWAIKHNKLYIGIDIVERYISNGLQRVNELKVPKSKYQFICGDAERIDTLIKTDELNVDVKRCLAFFPFNSFGNMPRSKFVIRGLAKSGLPFFISSYRISKKSTNCRYRYYKNCGYEEIKKRISNNEVRFTSLDGLNTTAYNPISLKEMLIANKIDVKIMLFSQIGIAYFSPSLY